MIMSKPSITDLEKHFVETAMRNADIGVGPYVELFEKAWAEKNDRAYGVACNSGTNAIYLALKALGIGPGDEVIVPEYTMIATAWAVSYTGATPVFVDCEDDLLVHEWPLSEKTKAIITVPIYGRKAPIPKLMREDFNVPVIEDMAEAHGIKPQGDIACYSFYGNKILTTGEGGMCLTNNKEWADEMRSLSNMYMDEKRTYLHPKQGHNFRMTNLQAAVGLAQVVRLEGILEKRAKIQDWYDQNIPEAYKMPHREVLWFMDIQTDRQEELKAYLEANGIPSRYGFKPMSMQPQYYPEMLRRFGRNDYIEKDTEYYKSLNAYKWSKRILYLPVWTEMSEKDVKTVCQTVSRFGKE